MSWLTPHHLEELEKREKRKAAVHEAGHATVAATKGILVEAWIYRNNSGGSGEKAWLGCCKNIPRVVWLEGKLTLAPDCNVLGSTYAVAGMVAEELDADPSEMHHSIVEKWEFGYCTPSPTDLELCSEDWHERYTAVQDAIKILHEHARLFDRLVLELLDREVILDDRIAALAAQFLH